MREIGLIDGGVSGVEHRTLCGLAHSRLAEAFSCWFTTSQTHTHTQTLSFLHRYGLLLLGKISAENTNTKPGTRECNARPRRLPISNQTKRAGDEPLLLLLSISLSLSALYSTVEVVVAGFFCCCSALLLPFATAHTRSVGRIASECETLEPSGNIVVGDPLRSARLQAPGCE